MLLMSSRNLASAPLCPVLTRELVDFKETRTPSGLITYKSTGKHDDTVMSLCLALRGVGQTRDFLDMMGI